MTLPTQRRAHLGLHSDRVGYIWNYLDARGGILSAATADANSALALCAVLGILVLAPGGGLSP